MVFYFAFSNLEAPSMHMIFQNESPVLWFPGAQNKDADMSKRGTFIVYQRPIP